MKIKPCKYDEGGHGIICRKNYDCENCEKKLLVKP